MHKVDGASLESLNADKTMKSIHQSESFVTPASFKMCKQFGDGGCCYTWI